MKIKDKKILKKRHAKTKDGAELKLALKRYRDIENGKTLPTFIEFFKLCIIFGIEENINLKEFYPSIYKQLKREIDKKKKLLCKL